MKRIKSRDGVAVGRCRSGGDTELIRLEKHAGLNTLLMSTTKDSSCVSGGLQGMLRMIQHGEVFEYVCASAYVHAYMENSRR